MAGSNLPSRSVSYELGGADGCGTETLHLSDATTQQVLMGGFSFLKVSLNQFAPIFHLFSYGFKKLVVCFFFTFGFFIAALSEKTCKKSDMVSMTICLAANGGKFQIRASIHLDFSTIVSSAPWVSHFTMQC